ncbi:ABC transporter substrate-binding protein [Paenibacillus aceris]|uniref:ABC-type glycerol-3-phosphate transport system substrate-binding protein n=1 Tax=Paenibacillus aceris TaxID=869555 RepID=A0ABS4I2D7_9BACL|nr:extracellular solute-binding protein [Paenibacillus aceris]MBP1964958.1 ABC-type glycerol-3-phosphate transport system substrate-binding protein [Paenibacillus aceris]NHW35619.1 extracellular solute-binding protein [Paenibacillus aceris]
MKKGIVFASLNLLLVTALVGCSNASSTPTSTQSSAATASPKAQSTPTKVVMYGDIKEFPSFVPILAKLKEDFKGKYDIETIPVDWGNLDKVVKTGIASGQPADIYTYWPNSLKPMIDANMITDLTPYLDANNGEWKNQFTSMLNTGKYGDKTYGIPISGVFPLIFANQDLLDKAGVKIPDNWNWDQFIATMQQIKEKTGVYPFGASNDLAVIMPREGLESLGAAQGKLDDLANMKIPATDPMFATMLTNVKKLNDGDYWYPGKGALTIKRDEEQSAFYQGKVAMIAEASSLVATISTNAKFKYVALPIPTMGDKLAYTGSADGFMIPSNAPHKEAAVEIMKKLTSPEYLQLHADAGFLVSSKKVQYKDPIITQLSALYDHAIANPAGFTYANGKIQDYFTNQLLPKLYLQGGNIPGIQGDIEALRKEALSSK